MKWRIGITSLDSYFIYGYKDEICQRGCRYLWKDLTISGHAHGLYARATWKELYGTDKSCYFKSLEDLRDWAFANKVDIYIV